ncbi:hypothetical protein [Bacillus sp. FJAT-29937]|nr:hypothetical protein [Bacillus sp. FJAT-29937]
MLKTLLSLLTLLIELAVRASFFIHRMEIKLKSSLRMPTLA